MNADELKERMTPTHLEQADDMKEDLEKEAAKPQEKDPESDPKSQREYTFQFNWEDGQGKVWKGEFTNKMISIRERQLVGIMRARLAGGVPLEALDDLTAEINLIIAHLTFSLTKRPDWASDLQELDDIRIIQEIYGEVLAHEGTFLGYRKAEGAS